MSTLVVGGGVTGLATAAFLLGRDRPVEVFEPGRPGNVVATHREGGFVAECGPESIRGGHPAVAELLDLLGLRPRVVKASPQSARRLLLHGGRLVALPSGPGGALRSPLWRRRELLRALLEPAVPRGRGRPESVAAFVRRRVGGLAALTDPLMAGIYAGDADLLDAETALSKPWSWVAEHGSLVRGALRAPKAVEPTGSFTFVEGMEELVRALVARVGPHLRSGTVRRLTRRTGGGWTADTDLGPREVDRVVVTCAPEAAARLLPDLRLPPLPRAPVAAVHLGYRDEDAPDPGGFGWLCPSRERRDVLGVLWVSSTFPGHAPTGHTLFRLMAGGTRDPGWVERDDAALVAHARRVLAEVQGVHADPVFVHVQRVAPGIPQYPVGWGRELAALRARSGVVFAGWYWGGIGIADGIAAARDAAA